MFHKPIVHIVDDDQAVRDSLQMLMRSENLNALTYGTAEQFLEQYTEREVSCLVLDIRMPGMSGLDLMNLLKTKNIVIPTVFISGHGDINVAVNAMRMGASDFVEKPLDVERLLNSVKRCLHQAEDNSSIKDTKERALARIEKLTHRERQVMDLLVDGKPNKVIASALNISPRTVELHRSRVMSKLEAKSISDVVRAAIFIE